MMTHNVSCMRQVTENHRLRCLPYAKKADECSLDLPSVWFGRWRTQQVSADHRSASARVSESWKLVLSLLALAGFFGIMTWKLN